MEIESVLLNVLINWKLDLLKLNSFRSLNVKNKKNVLSGFYPFSFNWTDYKSYIALVNQHGYSKQISEVFVCDCFNIQNITVMTVLIKETYWFLCIAVYHICFWFILCLCIY